MNIDEMIAKALEEEFEERVEQCCANTKKHRFSLAYRLWEYRTVKNFSRNRCDKHWTLRRARHIVTAAAIIVSSLLIGITVYAAIAIIGRFYFDDKKYYSKMFIESLSSDKTEIEEYYGLPEENGWELVSFEDMGGTTIINYICGKKEVSFCQTVINKYVINVNTENVVIEPISLYEENDGFIIDYAEEGCLLYWIYDGYLFSLSGNLDKISTVNLAYSTKIINFEENS